MMTLRSHLLVLPAVSCYRSKRSDLLTRLQEYLHGRAERNYFFLVIYSSNDQYLQHEEGHLETQEYWEPIVCLLIIDYLLCLLTYMLFPFLVCEASACSISNR